MDADCRMKHQRLKSMIPLYMPTNLVRPAKVVVFRWFLLNEAKSQKSHCLDDRKEQSQLIFKKVIDL